MSHSVTRWLGVGVGLFFMVFCGLVQDALAGAGAGGSTCLVNNPGSSVALRATIAIDYTPSTGDADYLFRVTRGGASHWYRLHLITSLSGITYEEMVCRAVNPADSSDPTATTALVQQIMSDFGLNKTELKLTDSSITSAEPITANQTIPGTNRAGSLGDVTLYAQ